MSPLDIVFFATKLQEIQDQLHKLTEKELSRELAKLADRADEDAGLFLLQTYQEKRGKC